MRRGAKDPLALLQADRPRSASEDRALADACLRALTDYRQAVADGKPSRTLVARARRAFLHLGGDPARSSASLKDYDHARFGPFLGVSDEGSAAGQIREAALASPKVRALPGKAAPAPLVVGVAVDAERLGGVGEVAVGPEEYADIWLACVDRLLVTTNIGTRVNVRVYRREPVVELRGDGEEELAAARTEIAAAFEPFVETPDRRPRPLTVFVAFPPSSRLKVPRRRAALRKLAAFVSSGAAAGGGRKAAPSGQELGLLAAVGAGKAGQRAALAAIGLAAGAGLKVVILEGVKRTAADRAVSLAGLLDYFAPGLVGPILREAAKEKVRVRAANLPDTETIARSTWVGLTTARSHGANLGKYGCFPLTRLETDRVVELVQGWLPDWSAAPVFFVDQGLLDEGQVDVGRDLARGLRRWLELVARRGVRVVLIDTVDKASGKRLLKRSATDKLGFLGPRQVEDAERQAARLGLKVLWAGGLGLREVYTLGRLGVFGVYVTTAAATAIPVRGSYRRDPALAGVKEPSREAVLRTKVLLEAGFLAARLGGGAPARLERLADELLAAHEAGDAARVRRAGESLARQCEKGWRAHWRSLGQAGGRRKVRAS
jgi:hypothetical protein